MLRVSILNSLSIIIIKQPVRDIISKEIKNLFFAPIVTHRLQHNQYNLMIPIP